MKTRQYLMMSGLLLVAALGMTSCVMTCNRSFDISDDITVEWRHLRNFERIEISGSPTVVYTQADTFGVRVEGPDNLIPRILTETEGGTLYVRNKGKMGFVNFTIGDKSDVTVYVSSPDLVGVGVSGSGDFISRKPLDTDTMDIALRGSGDITFELIPVLPTPAFHLAGILESVVKRQRFVAVAHHLRIRRHDVEERARLDGGYGDHPCRLRIRAADDGEVCDNMRLSLDDVRREYARRILDNVRDDAVRYIDDDVRRQRKAYIVVGVIRRPEWEGRGRRGNVQAEIGAESEADGRH